MSKNNRSESTYLLGFVLGVLLFMQGSASEPHTNPPIAAGVTFFYYDDLDEAADWYENKLGLNRVTDVLTPRPGQCYRRLPATDGR